MGLNVGRCWWGERFLGDGTGLLFLGQIVRFARDDNVGWDMGRSGVWRGAIYIDSQCGVFVLYSVLFGDNPCFTGFLTLWRCPKLELLGDLTSVGVSLSIIRRLLHEVAVGGYLVF